MTEIEPAAAEAGNLVPRGQDAVTMRASVATSRAEVARQRAALQAQQQEMKDDLERQRQELEAAFRARQAELDAQMAPLKAELKKLEEVSWTVDLYLGRDESLTLVRDGAPAPADTPLTIRQKVLVMAEESLILMDRGATGMDYKDINAFVTWLIAAPENLDRVLPEPKGVVVLIPTRVPSCSGNIWEDSAKNAYNEASYWLLRNGEKLYVLTVDEKLKIADRVLPNRTEFTDVFGRRLFGVDIGKPVVPGSEEWLEMQEEADARRRHFMRIVLVLQGIIDRTPVWHPMPETGLNLLSVADQDAGRVVLIQDGDTSLQLGDGHETFAAWQRRLNAQMRPGLRIAGDWRTEGFNDLWGKDWRGRSAHTRLNPPNVDSRPATDQPHLIEGRRDGGFVIRFERTDQVWRKYTEPDPDKPGWVYHRDRLETPTQRASCVVKTHDDWVLPFDLATRAEIAYFLNSREERSKHFLSMVPALRAVLAAKDAEAATEAPFRGLLARMLEAEGEPAETVPATLDELVHWWKVAHTWARPLNGEPKHEAKAAEQIITEYRARRAASEDGRADRMVAAGRRVPGVIAVAANRQGKWFAYAPSTPAHDTGVFLDITPIRANGTLGPVKTWQRVAPRSASLLQVAWSTEAWATWKFAANPNHYLTAPEREALVAELVNGAEGIPLAVTEIFDPVDPTSRTLALYTWRTGTPEGTEVRSTDDPYSWHYRGDTALITGRGRAVVKDTDGARLGDPRRIEKTYFGGYLGGSRWGDTPWWPDEAHRYSDVRPRLAWADEHALDRIKAYADRCGAAAKTEQAARRARDAEAYRYSRPVEALIRAEIEAAAKERFFEDYGAGAEDLWEAHLKTLPQRQPIHPRELWGLVAIALDHGHPVVGQSLDQLADHAWSHRNKAPGEWHPARGRIDLKGYGHIIVPEPPPVGDEDQR
ncbi:hypothetical protein V6N00_13105 [Tersicoccus sp. MR15.9]|uniref:hypothetical protein n=1 Tax=Tersicoccus mangrovi TaxID=3121635 RepID=UPI002FE5425A